MPSPDPQVRQEIAQRAAEASRSARRTEKLRRLIESAPPLKPQQVDDLVRSLYAHGALDADARTP